MSSLAWLVSAQKAAALQGWAQPLKLIKMKEDGRQTDTANSRESKRERERERKRKRESTSDETKLCLNLITGWL